MSARTRDGLVAVLVAALVPVLVIGATLAVYGPVRGHEFVDFDDNLYVTHNPEVRAGITWEGVRWAFTVFHASNWHPLTWISHMLDVELFGLDAGKHLSVNAALHALNAILLFAFLLRTTRAAVPSAFVALLFAVHPLRVESVAWVAERKDVLSGLFFFLALHAHASYARRPGVARYAALLVAAGLGLLAKPMLVTLPFVLLLVDLWPLRRWSPLPSSPPPSPSVPFGRLVAEKVPLLVLSLAVCAVTLRSQSGAVHGGTTLPLAERWIHAPIATLGYVARTVWPADLAAFYPHPALIEPSGPARVAASVASGALIVFLCAAALRLARRAPFVASGWLWFLGMLVPVIGLVQVGRQAGADRYAYLPTIGLYLIVAWSVWPALARAGRLPRALAGAAAALALLACAGAARAQVATWRDTETLWRRALAATDRNFLAHHLLGRNLLEGGRLSEAEEHLRACLAIKPNVLDAHFDLARTLERRGLLDEAAEQYRRILWKDPHRVAVHLSLGGLLLRLGRGVEARRHLEEVLRLRPDIERARRLLQVLEGREAREAGGG